MWDRIESILLKEKALAETAALLVFLKKIHTKQSDNLSSNLVKRAYLSEGGVSGKNIVLT